MQALDSFDRKTREAAGIIFLQEVAAVYGRMRLPFGTRNTLAKLPIKAARAWVPRH